MFPTRYFFGGDLLTFFVMRPTSAVFRSGSRGSFGSGMTRTRMMRLDLNRLPRCTKDRHSRKGAGRRKREARMTGISGDNYLGLVIYFVDRNLDEWSWEYWGIAITEDMDRVRLIVVAPSEGLRLIHPAVPSTHLPCRLPPSCPTERASAPIPVSTKILTRPPQSQFRPSLSWRTPSQKFAQLPLA